MRKHGEEVIEILRKQGMEAENVEIVKNGVPCKAIKICGANDSVAPVIYYSEQDTVEELMVRIHEVLKAAVPDVDAEQLMDWKQIHSRVYLSAQKQSNEKVVKKSYLNLELIVRIEVSIGCDTGSVKMTNDMLHRINADEADIWKAAVENTYRSISVRSMAETIGMEPTDEDSLYIASAGRSGGASVLYFADAFRKYCEENGESECYILPSSTEEVIIVSRTGIGASLSVHELADMVRTINAAQVDPIIQLEPAVYRYSVTADVVEIAGMV